MLKVSYLIRKFLYLLRSKPILNTLRGVTALLLLIWPFVAFPQTTMIVYDGITGISQVSYQNDTAIVAGLIPDSPADKAGLKRFDQLISINDTMVSGTGKNRRDLLNLLQDHSDKLIRLKIKRKGEEKQLSLEFRRDPYLFQIDSYDYLYLVDSLGEWDIREILSSSQDSLFKDPLVSKTTVYAVEKGSPAEKNGLLPGDQLLSLADEMDAAYDSHIGQARLQTISSDTFLTVLREDTLQYFFPVNPSQGDLSGITSQFEKDFSSPCVWLKITTESRLAASRTYLLHIPEMTGKDSLNFFYRLPSGEIIEKKSGILVPIEERDFIYKNWRAVQVTLHKGETQNFYLRWKSEESVEAPQLQAFAHDTIVRYDRFERMVLFGFLFTMLIISAFFLLLFAVIRERQYLYFALYIGSLAIFLFISGGYLDEYFWKETNFFLKFLEKFQPYIMSWISIFFLLFGIAYLDLKNQLKFWYRAVVFVLTLTGIRILLVFIETLFNFNYPILLNEIFRVVWILTVGIIPLFILILPAIHRIRAGFRPAWYFLIANLVLIPLIYITLYDALSTSTVLNIYQSIAGKLFISSTMYLAAVLQILIFSFGIARKIRLDEVEREKIQKQIIDQLKVNEQLKDQVNRELEQKVQERTREITDSIDYAQRIQDTVLPGKEYLDRVLPEYFVFYKPKDIVSGDFYWIKELKNSIIIIAADCTGHGVPGAFMSMLGITLLDEQLGRIRPDAPGKILDDLRSRVKEMLAQKGEAEEQKDGMDMAIAIIDKEKNELHFAGAQNSLYLIRNSSLVKNTEPEFEASLEGKHKLLELKGDKQPIGIHWEETEFSSIRLPLKDRDTLYVFTDGFIDQFGGKERKKFKTKRFKELLLSIQDESMDKQKDILENTLASWRGEISQIDDICIIGVRLPGKTPSDQ